MTAEIAGDTVRAIDVVYPDPFVKSGEDGIPATVMAGEKTLIYAGRAGYVTRTSLALAFPRCRGNPDLRCWSGPVIS